LRHCSYRGYKEKDEENGSIFFTAGVKEKGETMNKKIGGER